MRILWKLFWREKEFKRQLAHLAFGLGYALLFLWGYMTVPISLVLLGLGILASLWLKLRRSFIDKVILLLERDRDFLDLPLKGALSFVLGATITIGVFDFEPALAGILILSVVDSIGTLYGKYTGVAKIRWNPEKHMEGPILGGLAASILLLSFLPFAPAVLASFVGAFIDTLDLRVNLRVGGRAVRLKLDDNLLIPVMSAAVIQWML